MSTATDSPSASKIGSFGNSFWLALLAISVIVFGANTGVATYQGSRLSGASTGASDMRVLSQQLANQGREAVAGNAEAFKAFKETKQSVESTVADLQSRFGNEGAIAGPLAKLSATWAPLGKSADQIVASEAAVLALAGNADRFATQVPNLQAQLNEVVRAMSAGGAPSSQIYSALQQVVLAGTMARRVTEIRAGGAGAATAGDALGRDAVLFDQVLDGLRDGNPDLGIAAVRNGAALTALQNSQTLWTAMKKDLDAILASSRNLFAAQAAATALTNGSGQMLQDSTNLFQAFSAFGSVRDTRLFPNFWVGIASGIASLAS
ncbi:MAG: type IV pili methyl-accepting chemotaxis transducer N-terminal domain-containing protein, partial [Pseudoxanthomonas sp.]|nr:type IV pili methyl-accepting chemotaxis transducer N-terminal domain-containing protein [Pseudoxanthomonas sp.]